MKTPRQLRILIFLVLFVWSVVVFFPLYWMVSTAFKQPPDLFPTPTYLPWIQFQPSLLAFQSLLTEYRAQVSGAVRADIDATCQVLLGLESLESRHDGTSLQKGPSLFLLSLQEPAKSRL